MLFMLQRRRLVHDRYFSVGAAGCFARTGTLSRAAEELHITQPALSRNMKKLEATLGVSLFNRESSKITLNETGKIAAEYARRALDANQEMIEMTLAFDRRERSLTMGSCTILPIYDVLPLLQERFIGKAITTELSDREDCWLICAITSIS